MVLHVFNPETDFALASNSDFYTPPKAAIRIRKHKALMPAIYASEGDAILIIDDDNADDVSELPYHDLMVKKNIILLNKDTLHDFGGKISKVFPWGWNRQLRYLLSGCLPDTSILPSIKEIETIRSLSHRRTVFPLRQYMAIENKEFVFPDAAELRSMDEMKSFFKNHDHIYLKAPWSSSGRGVINSLNKTSRRLEEWTLGCIRSQGSVIAEEGIYRAGDFATEWFIEEGEANFAGFSFFKVSPNGAYEGNLSLPQREIISCIKKISNLNEKEIIDIQKEALDRFISPHYEGPVGIDMLADRYGRICPCVEINLRMTMGHMALYEAK